MMINKYKDRLWFSMALNAVLLIFHLCLYLPTWDTNDDVAIQSFFIGTKGIRDPHGVYIHIWLGRLFCRLYEWNDRIPWYPLAQYILIYCSLVVICWVLIRRLKQASWIWLIILLVSLSSFECYINVQFSKTTAVVCVAGLLLLFYALSQEKLSPAAYLAGLVFCAIGSMYRYTQFQCEIFLFAPLAVYLFLEIMHKGREERARKLGLCILTAFLTLGLGYGLQLINKKAYTSEEWRAYMTYNHARAVLSDYGLPDFEKNRAAYEALGIDETAYKLFEAWTHADSDKITTDVMKSIADLSPSKDVFSRKFIMQFLKKIPAGLMKTAYFRLYVLFLLCWLIRGRRRPQEFLTVLLQIVLVSVLYLYFFYLGRYLRPRVDFGIWITLAAGILWMIDSEKAFLKGRTGLILFTALFLLTQYHYRDDLRSNQEEKVQTFARRKEIVQAIHDDPDHLYLTKAYTITLAKAYNVWDVIPYGILENQYALGGWGTGMPANNAILERYDIGNPFPDMIDNETVYLMDEDIELTTAYLRKWYDPDAEAIPVKKMGPYEVYQIVTEAP